MGKGCNNYKEYVRDLQITLNIPFIELLTIVLHYESPGRSKKMYTKDGDSSYSDEVVAEMCSNRDLGMKKLDKLLKEPARKAGVCC